EDGGWVVIDRDVHNLGVVPVIRMANRQRTADRVGKSEISPEVMSITDAACRRLMGMEVASEFYGAPQRYILGASESAFQDA
ncbi:phage capsid protein, partial [Streptomyces sp. A73]|nr:phage capsid protein [Streptomyces sp. A73]